MLQKLTANLANIIIFYNNIVAVESKGRDLLPRDHGGVRGPLGRQVPHLQDLVLHEDPRPEVSPDGALARGHEDLGGRPLHRGGGLPGVPGLRREQPPLQEQTPNISMKSH